MNGRERLALTLRHEEPDRVSVDFGATSVTGIHVSAFTGCGSAVLGDGQVPGQGDRALPDAGRGGRRTAGRPGHRRRRRSARKTHLRHGNSDWKPFTLFDGTPLWCPATSTSRRRPTATC